MDIKYTQLINKVGSLTIRDTDLYHTYITLNHKDAFDLFNELIGAAYEIAEGMGWSGFEAKTQEILHLIECENNEDLR